MDGFNIAGKVIAIAISIFGLIGAIIDAATS